MINDNLKKINQILEIVKIMQQKRSGTFFVLFSIDTDIPPVDSFGFFFVFAFFVLAFVCFCFALFVSFTFYSYLFLFFVDRIGVIN